MTYANRPITGREYKLMLRTSKFEERDKGIKDFLDIIKSQIEILNVKEGKREGEQVYFDRKDKKHDNGEKKRRVWYLDTQNFELYKKNKFLVRIRKEKDDDYVTDLKCRNSDRYISASYDLSPNIREKEEKLKAKFEFEEDIIPRVESTNSNSPDFASKFSHSVSFHTKKELQLNTIADLLSIFPGLNVLNIDVDTELQKVNNFEVKEISIKLGMIKSLDKNDTTDDLSLSFWYLLDEGKKVIPEIVEFSFDYYVKHVNKANRSNGNLYLEEFPLSLVRKTNDFYLSLLKEQEFVDLNTAKTKTEFAYTYKLQL
jgi:hypothetical protein